MALIDPNTWFLQFSSKVYNIANGDGRPWGDGTAMSAREGLNKNPWDAGCKVTPLIGGFAAMSEMRESLESAIGQAPGLPMGQRGHVYIADWRLNPLRDLSEVNAWGTNPWQIDTPATIDQTAVGLILRLMQAGIKVRVMIWMPTFLAQFLDLDAHVFEHFYIAEIVNAENEQLMQQFNVTEPVGILALDLRVTELTPPAAAHHQKMMVIRVGTINVAYCGGVDLAFTRRDAPDPTHPFDPKTPSFLGGDWQSGKAIPPQVGWPHESGVVYTSVKKVNNHWGTPRFQQGTDLPANVYGDGQSLRQIWHDQHLKLEGPILKTLEEQFGERWIDTAKIYSLSNWVNLNWRTGQVIFSTDKALDSNGKIAPLPASDVPNAGSTAVQMWRTIPFRNSRTAKPYLRAEFTAMAGISNACKQARQLIWIFDQYFWSQPLARLLNKQVKDNKNLCVIIILPPFADSQLSAIHHARKVALNALVDDLPLAGEQLSRVGVFNLWNPKDNDPKNGRGIYCHAKVQMYDGSLLVCGSANLNRRSFTCDSELACAILDSDVVQAHQKNLWKLLFPNIPLNQPDFSTLGGTGGIEFLKKFNDAVKSNGSCLIADPWQLTPAKLPNGIQREQKYMEDGIKLPTGDPNLDQDVVASTVAHQIVYNSGLDPSSITRDIESYVREGGNDRDCRLDDIVERLEKPDKNGKWPWRKT